MHVTKLDIEYLGVLEKLVPRYVWSIMVAF